MSDSDLREAGRYLYKLSNVSRKKFEAAITTRGGVITSYCYTFPLDNQPYHAVITFGTRTHSIGLGKDTSFGPAVYISNISLECEEGRLKRRDLLDGVNGFIDHVHDNLPRKGMLATSFTMRNITPQQIRKMVLEVIDGSDLSEVLYGLELSGRAKKLAISEVDKMQEDGTVEFKDGKFRRLKW
jgi:hypothetical protein